MNDDDGNVGLMFGKKSYTLLFFSVKREKSQELSSKGWLESPVFRNRGKLPLIFCMTLPLASNFMVVPFTKHTEHKIGIQLRFTSVIQIYVIKRQLCLLQTLISFIYIIITLFTKPALLQNQNQFPIF